MIAPVFGIAGWKNAGKTTLTERLVAGFTLRGVRVATVKHSHHAAMAGGPETDSARHARAGAMATALVWPGGWMLDAEAMAGQEPDLPGVLARLSACDLVLVDMQMPGCDGITTLRDLRDRKQTSPVLAVSSECDQASVERYLAAGCNGYLPKPVDRDVLRRALVMHLAPVK